MPFVRQPGITGKIYLPETSSRTGTKHPCQDCFACQMCSEDRCRICQGGVQGSRCDKERAVDPESPARCRTRKGS